MSNKLTLKDILEVIDNHIESETQFMFVCDKDLAEIICEYVADNYDLYDEDMELSDKHKDYYVSLYFDYGEIRFYCETARGCNGTYKYLDATEDRVDYFICNGMSEYDADDKLDGDNCTWNWIDLADDPCENCDDVNCRDCVEGDKESEEFTDEQRRDVNIVEDFTYKIETANLCNCGCTLRNILFDFLEIGKKIGYEDARDEIKEFIDS